MFWSTELSILEGSSFLQPAELTLVSIDIERSTVFFQTINPLFCAEESVSYDLSCRISCALIYIFAFFLKKVPLTSSEYSIENRLPLLLLEKYCLCLRCCSIVP